MWSPGTVKNHLQMRFESLASPDVKTEVCASSTSTSPLTSAATSTAAPLHRGQVLLIDRKTKAVQRTQSLRTPRDRKAKTSACASPLTRSSSFKDDLRSADSPVSSQSAVMTSRKNIVIISKGDQPANKTVRDSCELKSLPPRECSSAATSSKLCTNKETVAIVEGRGCVVDDENANEVDEVSVRNLCNKFEFNAIPATTTTTATAPVCNESRASQTNDNPASQPSTPQPCRRSSPSRGVGDSFYHQRRSRKLHGKTHPLTRLSHGDANTINRNKFYSTM